MEQLLTWGVGSVSIRQTERRDASSLLDYTCSVYGISVKGLGGVFFLAATFFTNAKNFNFLTPLTSQAPTYYQFVKYLPSVCMTKPISRILYYQPSSYRPEVRYLMGFLQVIGGCIRRINVKEPFLDLFNPALGAHELNKLVALARSDSVSDNLEAVKKIYNVVMQWYE